MAKQTEQSEAAPEPQSRTVYHPTFPDISREVAADDVEAYRATGWRLTPIKSD